MANDGTGANWDTTDPANSALLSDGAKQVRDLRIGIGTRVAYEHTAPAGSSAGGVHKQGSAMLYVQESAPTLRPDGVTAFTSADLGRTWFKASTGALSILTATTPTWTAVAAGGGGGTTALAAVVREEQTALTDGGNFTSGAWRQRVLNTISSDPSSIVTLGSNQFTLSAGTYLLRAEAPASQVDIHQARLQNVTDGTYIYGSTEYSNAAGAFDVSRSFVHGCVVLGGTKVFQLDHRCQTTKNFQGFGYANAKGWSTNVEVYSQVVITKLA